MDLNPDIMVMIGLTDTPEPAVRDKARAWLDRRTSDEVQSIPQEYLRLFVQNHLLTSYAIDCLSPEQVEYSYSIVVGSPALEFEALEGTKRKILAAVQAVAPGTLRLG